MQVLQQNLNWILGMASVFVGLTSCGVFSQNYKPILENLDFLAKNKLSDQVYIQISKGVYETGEDLWFKAYVLDNQFFIPSDKSKTLYLRLSREGDTKAVWEEKYEIYNGFSEGHIYVNDTLSSGTYELAAFTQNSIFSDDNEYHGIRKIVVVNSIDLYSPPRKLTTNSLRDFSLLPEGGHLVSEINNRIAFKAVDSLGFPFEVSGILFEDRRPLLEFSSEHAGMGSFDFIPRSGKKYHVSLNEQVVDSIFQLPEIRYNGIVLKSEGQVGNNLVMKVFASSPLRGSRIFMRLQVRGVAYNIVEVRCKDSLSIKIPLDNVPQGIAEITAYDENLRPIAERLVYVNQNLKLYIHSTLSKNGEYGVRDKATLKLKVTTAQGNPIQAHLGVSVYDHAYHNVLDVKNILTHLYLTTQLKGKVYNPDFYFAKDNDNVKRAMDLLLMTHGWRRYVWSESDLKRQVKTRKALVQDGISGSLITRKRAVKDTMSQQVIMAYNPVRKDEIEFIIPDTSENFAILPEHLKIGELGYLYLRVMADQKSIAHIKVMDNSFELLEKTIGMSYPLSAITRDTAYVDKSFARDPNLIELEGIQVKSKKKNVFREKYLGKLDSIAKAETTDYVCKYNILNCEYHVNDSQNKKPVEGEVYLYTEVWDEGSKSWVKGHKDVTNSKYFRNPALPPYRYPSYTDAELLEKFGIVRVKGYYGHREFYQPNYDFEEDLFPDYRNTLLWNPSVITDINGEAELEFFCSDINTLFFGTIEGVSGDGLLGNNTFEFLVK